MKGKETFVFIDASNLFYGGEKSLGWKIDYEKLFGYLNEKYGAEKVFYFGGVETHGFQYDYLAEDSVPINDLEKFLSATLKKRGSKFDEASLLLWGRHIKRIHFYKKLESFGYSLYLKPVKLYEQEDGSTKRKANCDVEMAFYIMNEINNFSRVIILSGDGDFLPVLKHLKKTEKDVLILSRGSRTAKEIRRFAGGNFRDFEYLKFILKREK
ncbi:MAG: NYN domain-containing protein [Candidatus Paceibacterota bacterium]|jgi:uncharacterized LabA/DUF88 family protein|nr:NYN domain-containing protein [Candidatus Paceibacterota bacterium]